LEAVTLEPVKSSPSSFSVGLVLLPAFFPCASMVMLVGVNVIGDGDGGDGNNEDAFKAALVGVSVARDLVTLWASADEDIVLLVCIDLVEFASNDVFVTEELVRLDSIETTPLELVPLALTALTLLTLVRLVLLLLFIHEKSVTLTSALLFTHETVAFLDDE
jgi:hypothetical protein